MKIEITRVSPLYPTAVFLQWDYTPDPGVTGTFAFVVERSGSPGGPWAPISGTLHNVVSFYDSLVKPDVVDEVNTLSTVRSIYYRVTVTAPNNSTATSLPMDMDGERARDDKQVTENSGLTNLRKRKTLLRRKILRDEYIQLKVLNGVEIAVLKRRHFGERCKVCYDPVTKLNTKTNCPSCYGVTWVGGYYPPIMTYARYAASGTQTSLGLEGKNDVNSNGVTLLNYPKVEEGDVLVELESNKRWLIKQNAPTEIRRTVVHQRVLAVEIPRHAPEYKIPVGE